jgi:hypothetical protein
MSVEQIIGAMTTTAALTHAVAGLLDERLAGLLDEMARPSPRLRPGEQAGAPCAPCTVAGSTRRGPVQFEFRAAEAGASGLGELEPGSS